MGRCARWEEELRRGCSTVKRGTDAGAALGARGDVVVGAAVFGKHCAAVAVADKGADKETPKGV